MSGAHERAGAIELGRVRRDVEMLAAMERGSAGPGEHASGEWLRGRLMQAGAVDARLHHFRYQPTFAYAHAAHLGAGVLGATRGGAWGAALALAALISFDLDFSGRSQWVRRLLPSGEGTTVTARVAAGGERRRTVVLVAHHDAARTGLMWHPAAHAPIRKRAARSGKVDSFATLPTLALGLAACGGLSDARAPRLGRALRFAGGALLAGFLGLLVDVARGDVVPAASDNASGVAAVLALVERFAAEPLEGCDIIAVFPGCEESGMGGMSAWLASEGSSLDRRTTLVLGLDTVGAGEPVVLAGEGPVRTERYRDEDLELALRGAERAGEPAPRHWRLGGWTDPILARFSGLPAVSLLSVRDGGFPNYHLPTDTPDRVDWRSVERSIRIAGGIAEEWAER